jgi:hypothetical protein
VSRNNFTLLEYIKLTVQGQVSSQVSKQEIHQCQYPAECQQVGNSEVKELHAKMNHFFSRLDEHQRHRYAALGAKKLGHGGTKRMSQISGMHFNTIPRGRRELEEQLENCPDQRVRQV